MEPYSRISRWRSFLYRRLARWITCEVKLLGQHSLALDSKFQVNSLQDVFCHPFYWQLYNWLPEPPKLVVDLGAHCGHFSMLADVCFRTQFGVIDPEYLLVEPNPKLTPVIRRNLKKSGLCPRFTLEQGLVGRRNGTDTLWVSSSNYLSASLQRSEATNGVSSQYLDLDRLVGTRAVQLLKVDVEGAEYELVANYPALFRRVERLMMEIHSAPPERTHELHRSLAAAGLHPFGRALDHAGFQLAMFQRE